MSEKKDWKLEIPDDRLAHIIKYANRLFIKNLQERLDEFGVSFGHWAILRVLWTNDGITQKDISLQTGLMEPTIHAALKSLESQNVIVRKRSDSNLKNWYVFLTNKGKKLEGQLVPLAIDVNQQAVINIPENELFIMRKVLMQMIDNLEK